MPLVSVVIPAFNAQQTIGEAIGSVLAQTEWDLEVIVCDDASTDKTGEVTEAIHDSRVRLIRNISNLGEGASRDRAIEEATGTWIAVLDADDAWHPSRLETLLQAAGTAADTMLFDDLMICHHTEKGLRPWRALRGAHAFGARNGGGIDVAPFSWASARRFLIKPLMPTAALKASGVRHSGLRFSADTEFFLRLIAAGLKLHYVPKPYYRYRIMPGSMSAIGARAQIMRDMLVSILPLFEGDALMLRALQRKISYRDLTMAIKSANAVTALRLAWKQPSLIAELIARSAAEVPYHLDRLLHRGAGIGKRVDGPADS